MKLTTKHVITEIEKEINWFWISQSCKMCHKPIGTINDSFYPTAIQSKYEVEEFISTTIDEFYNQDKNQYIKKYSGFTFGIYTFNGAGEDDTPKWYFQFTPIDVFSEIKKPIR